MRSIVETITESFTLPDKKEGMRLKDTFKLFVGKSVPPKFSYDSATFDSDVRGCVKLTYYLRKDSPEYEKMQNYLSYLKSKGWLLTDYNRYKEWSYNTNDFDVRVLAIRIYDHGDNVSFEFFKKR